MVREKPKQKVNCERCHQPGQLIPMRIGTVTKMVCGSCLAKRK